MNIVSAIKWTEILKYTWFQVIPYIHSPVMGLYTYNIRYLRNGAQSILKEREREREREREKSRVRAKILATLMINILFLVIYVNMQTFCSKTRM